MSDFDKFLESQLVEYGVVDSVKSNLGHKLGAPLTKLAARMGSHTAQGSLNLRDETKKLYDAFKMYCGEQRIDMSRLCAEDVADFLVHKVEFQIDPFELVYQQAPADPQVEQAMGLLHGYFGTPNSADQNTALAALQSVVQLAQSGNKHARFGLWELSRNYRSAKKLLSKYPQAVGKHMNRAALLQLLERMASIILKRRANPSSAYAKKGAGAAPAGKKAQPQVAVDPNGNIQWNAKQGMVVPVDASGSAGWDHPAFEANGIFASAGMKNLRTIGHELFALAKKNDAPALDKKKDELKALLHPPAKAYQVARMLLEFFAPTKMHRDLWAACATMPQADQARNYNELLGIVQTMQNNQSGYDADDIVKRLHGILNDDGITSLIVALVMGLSDAYEGGSAGPGAP